MYLNCHTFFSLKHGTLSPADLVEEAYRCGVETLVLTDINSTSGYIDVLKVIDERKNELSLRLVVGIEFRHDQQLRYIGIAKNNVGFEQLNRFLSHHNGTEEQLPTRAPELPDVFFIYGLPQAPPPDQLRKEEWVGIRPEELTQLFRSPWLGYQGKLVALAPVTFHDKRGFNAHRLLRSMGRNTLLSKLAKEDQAGEHEKMLPEEQLRELYRDYPRLVDQAQALIDQCSFEMELYTNKNKQVFSESMDEDRRLLRQWAWEGYRRRYGFGNAYVEERLWKELDTIERLGFCAYFLVALDVVRFSSSKGFAHVGRGSGANSLVAYCLGITEVDPIELDLYFERFLNPYRTSPPDFDLDFSWQERDAVTQYMFDRWGQDHTVLICTYSTFQRRSVVRELGKVFGLPKPEIDRLVDYPHLYADRDHISKLIFQYAEYLHNMPSHLSIHAGGVLVSEEPIYRYTAVNYPPKGFPITHWDMVGAEDLGLHKFDILSQRGLGHIRDTVDMVARNQGVAIDINQTQSFKQDPAVKELLQEGRTMGCFYVESPAMRMLLGKLKCDDYLTLVAASSIIRPGVARSGMMREYIHRHNNPGDFEYIHPKMAELMEESYGVMVYQEDVLKVAHHFAGLDLGEADILRRGMSGKVRSKAEMQRVQDTFFNNCHRKGYPQAITQEVWRQIESFSGYSFSKAHSASYAVESYQSLYLKAYFPREFMVGVINNFGGFYRTEYYLHEARMDGAEVEGPCVNHGEHLTYIEGATIWLGFIHLKSLESKVAQLIPAEREQNGAYQSMDDFIARVPCGLESLTVLIRIGAFRFTGQPKRALLWQAHLHFGRKQQGPPPAMALFAPQKREFTLPNLERHPLEDAFDELEILGFPLCDPFSLLKSEDRGNTMAMQMMKRLGKRVSMIGYLITIKHTRTKDEKLMHFATFYDAQGRVFDTTHFPPVAKKYPFRGRGFYRLVGKVVEDFGYPMLEVIQMDKLPLWAKDEVGQLPVYKEEMDPYSNRVRGRRW
ncbi:MAG: DNA polymerase III subunit alpha [Bacteroidota bacterium]